MLPPANHFIGRILKLNCVTDEQRLSLTHRRMVRAVRQLGLRRTHIAVLEGASHVQHGGRVRIIDILIIGACAKHCIRSGCIGTWRRLLLQMKFAGSSSYQLFKRRLLRISFLV